MPDTGSGKSGYVRVLKQACGAKSVGSLHSNVFTGPTQQGCSFDLAVNGQCTMVSTVTGWQACWISRMIAAMSSRKSSIGRSARMSFNP